MGYANPLPDTGLPLPHHHPTAILDGYHTVGTSSKATSGHPTARSPEVRNHDSSRSNRSYEHIYLEHFRQLIESSDDAIISKSIDGIITSWNRSAESLFGYKAYEVIGKSVRILYPENRMNEYEEIIARIISGERIEHMETERVRKDGTVVMISLTVSPINSRDGTLNGISTISRDITDKKRIEREIEFLLEREQEARKDADAAKQHLYTLFMDAPALIAVYSGKDFQIDLINDALRNVMGGKDHIGQFARKIFRNNPSVLGRLDMVYRNGQPVTVNEQPIQYDWEGNGHLTVRYFNTTYQPLRYGTDTVSGIMEFSQDVTEAVTYRNQIQDILESISDAFYAVNESMEFTYLNEKAERLWKRPRKELLGRSLWDVISNRPDNALYRGHLNALSRRKVVRTDAYIPEIHTWVSASIYPSKSGLSVYIQDITTRKESEDRLRFHAILNEHISDAVIATDLDQTIISWNPEAERLYGWTKNQAIGQTANTLIPTAFVNVEKPGASWQQAVNADGQWKGLVRQQRKNGTTLYIHASTAQVRDTDGQVVGYVTVNRDITDRQRAEDVLRYLSEASTILSSSFDYHDTLTSIAKQSVKTIADFCSIFIIEHGTAPPWNCTAAAPGLEDHRAFPIQLDTSELKGIADSGATKYVADNNAHDDNSVNGDDPEVHQLRSYVIIPIENSAGKRGSIAFGTGVTGFRYTPDQVRMMEELAHRIGLTIENADLYKNAQSAIRLRDDFISMASHELKTPITSLKAYAQILERQFRKKGDEDASANLGKINAQLNKLTRLVTQLLDISRLESGRMELREELFTVDDLVKEIVEMMARTTDMHDIVIDGQTSRQVFADRDRIGQVLINLIANAIKYSPQKSRITVTSKAGNGFVTIAVIDSGIGIDKKHQDRIFDRFYQIDDPLGKTYPGLGIGLYIAKSIVSTYGGQLHVKSAPGEGSVFSFTLPFSRDTAGAVYSA